MELRDFLAAFDDQHRLRERAHQRFLAARARERPDVVAGLRVAELDLDGLQRLAAFVRAASVPDSDNEDDEWVFPLANPFQYSGNDVIDAHLLDWALAPGALRPVGVTVYGGPGADTIDGGTGTDTCSDLDAATVFSACSLVRP